MHSPLRSASPAFATSSTAMRTEHIYFRPSSERRFTLLDDLSRDAVASLTAAGLEPCAVIETSPGNFQAWLKHSRILSKELGTFAAQLLAHRFGADPSAADWRRFGRLPGFTNRKSQYRQHNEVFPFVRLHTCAGQQFTAAAPFDVEAIRLYNAHVDEGAGTVRAFAHGSADRLRLCFHVSLHRSVRWPSRSRRYRVLHRRLRERMVAGAGCRRPRVRISLPEPKPIPSRSLHPQNHQ